MIKIFLLVLSILSTSYSQKDSLLNKLFNDFNLYSQSVETTESCQILKKQLSNAFELSMARNATYLKEAFNTEDDIPKLFDKFLTLFIKNDPILVKKLLQCTDSSGSIFDAYTVGWKLMLYALYEDPKTFLKNYGSFEILYSIHLQTDSLEMLFNNWMPEKVKVSEKPIEYRNGNFFENNTDQNEYYFNRDGEVQIEYYNRTNEISRWEVKWNNMFEYELTFLSNDSGINMFEVGDKILCRITEITDYSYKVIIKTKYNLVSGELSELN